MFPECEFLGEFYSPFEDPNTKFKGGLSFKPIPLEDSLSLVDVFLGDSFLSEANPDLHKLLESHHRCWELLKYS